MVSTILSIRPLFKMKATNDIIVLDGVKTRLESADLDKDGVAGEVETIKQQFDKGMQPIIQPTEISESLKELNKDDLEMISRMSGIDLRARLHAFETTHVLALDALVSLGCLPTKCLAFTRQKKRLSVSLDGRGREEIVQLVAGKRELEARTGMGGFAEKVKGFFSPQNPQ
jgi:hypothetical protein